MAVLQTNEIFKTELAEGQHRLSDEEIHQVQRVVYEITIDITNLCDKYDIPYMLTGGTALGAVRHGGFIPWDDDIDMVVARKYIDELLDLIEQEYSDKYYVDAPLRTEGYLTSFIQIHKKGTICQEYLEIPEERCGIKIDIFVAENTYNNKFLRTMHGIQVELGLFILSCYRMHLWKREFYALAKGNRKASLMIHMKSAIGMLFVPAGKFWYKTVQNSMKKCKDNDSEYVVVPSGRKHFFGELKTRKQFLATETRTFEDRKFSFPKNIDWYLSYMYGDYMKIPPVENQEHHVVYKLKV